MHQLAWIRAICRVGQNTDEFSKAIVQFFCTIIWLTVILAVVCGEVVGYEFDLLCS